MSTPNSIFKIMKKVCVLLSISALLCQFPPVAIVSAQTIAPIEQIAQTNNSAKFYFDRAEAKLTSVNSDHKGAIADYDTAIRIDPKYVNAYIHRGMAKVGLKDNQGAITDLNTAISIDPKSAEAYFTRSVIKHDYLKDKQGAISDLTKASELAHEQGDMDSYKVAIEKIKEWK
jgi:tetratricopeptide (TPR) repeat protein